MTEEQRAILKKSIEVRGKERIVDWAFEESAELIKALMKERRYGLTSKRHSDICNEIADVTICLEWLKLLFGCENDVREMVDYKINREKRRAEEIVEKNGTLPMQLSYESEPVKHAKWENIPFDHDNEYTCSNCGQSIVVEDEPDMKYCFKCGAKMDGD